MTDSTNNLCLDVLSEKVTYMKWYLKTHSMYLRKVSCPGSPNIKLRWDL